MLDQNGPGRRGQGDNSASATNIDPPMKDPVDLGAMMALKDAPSELGDTPPLSPIEVRDIVEDVASDMANLVLEPVVIEMISKPHLKPPQIIDFCAKGARVVVEVEFALNNRNVDLQEVQTPKQARLPSPDLESLASHRSDDEQSSSDSSSRPSYRAHLATVVNDDNSSDIPLRRRTNARFIDFYESSISYFGNYGSKRLLLLSQQNDPSYLPNARRVIKRVRQRRTTIPKGRHYNNTPLIKTPASQNEQHRELPQADDSSTDQLAGPSTSRALPTNPPNITTRKRTKAPNYRESPISFSSGFRYNRLLPVQEDLTYVPPSLIRKKRVVEKRRIVQTGRFRDSPSMRAHVSPKETSENRANDEPIRENEGIINVKKDNLKTGENSKSTAIEEGTNRNVELDQAIGQRIGSASLVLGDDDAKRVRQRRTIIYKGRRYTSVIRTPASRNEHRELPQADDSSTDQLAGPSTSRTLSTNPPNTTAHRRTKAPNYRDSPISFNSGYSYKRFRPVQEDLFYVPPSLIRKKRVVEKRRIVQTGRFRDSPSMRAHVSPKETSENRANDELIRENEGIINVKKDNLKTGENSKSTAIEEGTNRNVELDQAIGQRIGSASPVLGDDDAKRVRQRRTIIYKGRRYTSVIRTPASRNEHRELPQADDSSTDQLAGPSTSRTLSTNPPNTTAHRRTKAPNYRDSPISFNSGYSYKRFRPVQEDLFYVPPSLIRKKRVVEKRRIVQTGRFRDSPSMRAHVSPKETSENRANDEPIRENEGIINVKKDNLKTGENSTSTAIEEGTNRNVELDQAIGQRIGSASPVLGDDDAKRVRQRRTIIYKGRRYTSVIRTPASRNEHRELPQADDSSTDQLAGPSTSRTLSTNPPNTTAHRRTKAPNYRDSPISFNSGYSYKRFRPVQEDLFYVPPSLIRKKRVVEKRRIVQTGRFRDSPSMRAHVSPKETSENRANDEPIRENEGIINVKKDNLKTGENSTSTAIEEGTNRNVELDQAIGQRIGSASPVLGDDDAKRVRQRRTIIYKGRRYTSVIRNPASRNEHRELPQADDSSTDQLAGPSTSRTLSTNPPNTTAHRRTKAPNYRDSPISFNSGYSYKRFRPVQEDLFYVPPSLIRKKIKVEKRRVMQTGRFRNSPSIKALVSPKETSENSATDEPLRENEDIIITNVKNDNLKTGENSESTAIEEGTNRTLEWVQAIGQCIGSASTVYGDDEESNLESSPFNTKSPQNFSALNYIPSPEY